MNIFDFNGDSKYPAMPTGDTKHDLRDLAKHDILTSPTPTAGFEVEFPDIFGRYRLPAVSSNTIYSSWNGPHSVQFGFWQNQLNFAVWCATAGCGITMEHLGVGCALVREVFKFHMYYTTRRILSELQVALPTDEAWDAHENSYDERAYERLCHEFGVDKNTDWRCKGDNHGLGTLYNWYTNIGPHPFPGRQYDPAQMHFGQTKPGSAGMYQILQDEHTACVAWTTFIPDNGATGFTQAGVERINDCIRIYVWALLGAQSQTRSSILGVGTAFDAQKQFLADIEDSINRPVDLPSDIQRYQDVLQYARSKVDFVFGRGLYMAPSDMELQIGTIAGYNNEIIIAGNDMVQGRNIQINSTHIVVPPTVPATGRASGNAAKVAVTDTNIPSPTMPTKNGPHFSTSAIPREHPPLVVPTSSTLVLSQHEKEKTALIVGGVTVGLALLWLQ